MDKIFIRDLLVRGIVGLNPKERINKQDIVINIELSVDLQPSALSDCIDDTVNYRTVSKDVIHIIENTRYLLIESLSLHIAEFILRAYPVADILISIDKPEALRFSRSVAVQMFRRKEDLYNDAYLVIGSNIQKESSLKKAFALIQRYTNVQSYSAVYETLPVGKNGEILEQESYYNMAFHLRTKESFSGVKKNICTAVEDILLKDRLYDKYAPRVIDCDLILFNQLIVEEGPIVLPDPDLAAYEHILVPLAEIAPYYIHPRLGKKSL